MSAGSETGRRYGFVKPGLTRLFMAVDAAGGLLAGRKRDPRPRRAPERILLVNLAHFGDVLLTTPAAASIRAAFPHAHLAMLVGPWSASVVANNPRLDEILVHAASWWDRDRGSPYLVAGEFRRLIGMLRRGRYDAVVNFKSFAQENLAAALARIPHRLGYGIYGGGFLHTTCVAFPWGAHTVEQHATLAAALGASSADPVPEIFPSDEDVRIVEEWLAGAPRPLFALHLGAGAPAKMWPVDRFAEFARLAEDRWRAHTVLVGGGGEEALAARYRRLAPEPARDA
ncbi:MAG: glycosyltransferase family 9 protein, partial [Candidatus Latescibacteria bacterium]|nr:glycosyltransferase family 9 protein [Candidatus Latescibacterota bacterium]